MNHSNSFPFLTTIAIYLESGLWKILIQYWLNSLIVGFLDTLVDQSSITRRQLESITSYLRVTTGEIRLREAASLSSQGRTKGKLERPLTIGSYYRTVRQARVNVRESLVTVVIALWLRLIKVEDVQRLFELVGRGSRELSDEESERFLQLLDALLRRMIV
jgi:hypothetical protein